MTTRKPGRVLLIWSALLLVAASPACDKAPRNPAAPTSTPANPQPPPTPTAQIDGKIAFVSTRDGSPFIYVTNADGSGVTRLASGRHPAWSRDGRRIAFNGVDGGIYVMNADGSGQMRVGEGGFPDWSPDGTRIVFNSLCCGVGGIFAMNADGSAPTRIVASDFVQRGDALQMPIWSPDGRQIAFIRANYDEQWQIYVVNADGSNPQRLLNGAIPQQSEPAWSPDGTSIVFESSNGIGVLSVDGSGWRMLALGKLFDPDWTADGRSVVYNKFTSSVGDGVSPMGSRMRIFVTADDGSERQVVPEAAGASMPNYWDYQAVCSRAGR
jgi:Tol biopolymer transport system component